MMKPLNKKISEARKALGMTQEQVAEALNVSRQTVSHWENGRMQPDDATAQQLFALLKIEAEEVAEPKAKQPARGVWKLAAAFLCGVLATLLVVYGIVPLFAPAPQPAAVMTADEPTADAQQPLPATDHPIEWYQQPAVNEAGKAYVKLTALQSPVKLTVVEDDPQSYKWNIVFTFEEINGIPFTVTRMTEIFFDNEGYVVESLVMGSEEFAGFFQEYTLVSGKNYGYNIGRFISSDIAYAVVMEGVDANGNQLTFPLYIPLSQEVEKVLTPADFAPAAQEEGKAFISMTADADPVPMVDDPFFDGDLGWFFNVQMQNETDIPFTPDGLTLALFNGEKMSSVINMPGTQVQEWLGGEAFVKGENAVLYEDAARKHEITHIGLRLTGTDAGGNELAFAVLMELSQELAQ